jgi:hypothetical protein
LIEGVFQDRLTDEYMAGNRILWLPLEQLRNDLNTPNFDGSSPDILGKWPSDSLGDFEIDLQDPFYFNAPLEP